jgi:predicted DNA-binding transcriptional regulator AlpA
MQLPLLFFSTVTDQADAARSADGRLPSLDRMSTREVLRITNVNRSTLYRWVKKKRFPRKHKSGGWLRADVERWLTEHEGEQR